MLISCLWNKWFHIFLSSIYFKVITGCDSFRFILNRQEINPQISRWVFFLLQNYDFEIFHRSNKNMQDVETFSRCHSILVQRSQ